MGFSFCPYLCAFPTPGMLPLTPAIPLFLCLCPSAAVCLKGPFCFSFSFSIFKTKPTDGFLGEDPTPSLVQEPL